MCRTNATTIGRVGKGKVKSWAACKDEAIRRGGIQLRRKASLQTLPAVEQARLAGLSSVPRDDSKGMAPGSERGDEEERVSDLLSVVCPDSCTHDSVCVGDQIFMASLSDEDREFLELRSGLGNSQRAEVAWLEEMGYAYEELDVRDFDP